MRRIPFAHLIAIRGFEKDTADSKDASALIHSLRITKLRRGSTCVETDSAPELLAARWQLMCKGTTRFRDARVDRESCFRCGRLQWRGVDGVHLVAEVRHPGRWTFPKRTGSARDHSEPPTDGGRATSRSCSSTRTGDSVDANAESNTRRHSSAGAHAAAAARADSTASTNAAASARTDSTASAYAAAAVRADSTTGTNAAAAVRADSSAAPAATSTARADSNTSATATAAARADSSAATATNVASVALGDTRQRRRIQRAPPAACHGDILSVR